MDIDQLQQGFLYLLLERVDLEQNANRFYYLAWQPALFAEGTVVRSYGRKDGQRRTLRPLPYPSLAEAWPLMRAILRRRLRQETNITLPLPEQAEYERRLNDLRRLPGHAALDPRG